MPGRYVCSLIILRKLHATGIRYRKDSGVFASEQVNKVTHSIQQFMEDVKIGKFVYKKSVMPFFLPSKCMTNHIEADKLL